jgi:hypothetical protein
MNDEPTPTPTEETPKAEAGAAPQGAAPSSAEAWDEVGRQFAALGASLADAFRAAWDNVENRKRVQEMQSGLETIVDEVGQAIKDTASSEKVQQVKQEAGKAASSAVSAGEQTVQEVRPHLINALRAVNDELQRFIQRIESQRPAESGTPAETPAAPEPPASEPPPAA